MVKDGIYYENLNVDKQLTIKSENGSARCIIDGRGKGNVVTLEADGIAISGNLEDWTTHVMENNTVNDKPIYYFKWSRNREWR